MKTILFSFLLALPLLNGCVKMEKPEVRVSSNVDEEGRYYPLDGTPITISKEGYVTATFTLTPLKKMRLMSTASGDASIWRWDITPFSSNDASMSLAMSTGATAVFISVPSSDNDASTHKTTEIIDTLYAGTTGVAFLPTYMLGLPSPILRRNTNLRNITSICSKNNATKTKKNCGKSVASS